MRILFLALIFLTGTSYSSGNDFNLSDFNYYACAEKVDIYSSPDPNSEVFTTLPYGTEIKPIGDYIPSKDGWTFAKIRIGEHDGYINDHMFFRLTKGQTFEPLITKLPLKNGKNLEFKNNYCEGEQHSVTSLVLHEKDLGFYVIKRKMHEGGESYLIDENDGSKNKIHSGRLAFSPDRTKFFVSSYEVYTDAYNLAIYSIVNRKPILKLDKVSPFMSTGITWDPNEVKWLSDDTIEYLAKTKTGQIPRRVIFNGRIWLEQYSNPSPSSVTSTESASSSTMVTGISIAKVWEIQDLQSQYEAGEIYQGNGFVYVGGGKKIAKVEISSGKVLWSSINDQSYQPSYPVSNGSVVVFGTYYRPASIMGLDDKTGALLWKIPVGGQVMSGARFSGDLVYIGSYDKYLYAIDWKKGEVRWRISLGNFTWSTPYLHGNQLIVGSYDGNLYFIDKDTGQLISKHNCGGQVASNPVVASGLLFVSVDRKDPSTKDPKSSSNTRNQMLVINLKENKVINEFISKNSFSKKIIVSEEDVFFFDADTAYAYNPKTTHLNWEAKIYSNLQAFPFLFPSKVVFLINRVGRHGPNSSRILVLDRKTGKELSTQETGGVPIHGENYLQIDNILVTTYPFSAAYKINPKALIKKPSMPFEWEKKSKLSL